MTQPTLLFIDLCNTVNWFGSQSRPDGLQILSSTVAQLQNTITQQGGVILECEGNELLARFSAAETAAATALNILKHFPKTGIGARMGLHLESSEDAVETTARLTGLARNGELLCSSLFARLLQASSSFDLKPRAELGKLATQQCTIDIFQHVGRSTQTGPASMPALKTAPSAEPARLSIRCGDRVFLLGNSQPFITLGRDPGNTQVIDDRRVSRLHARIEQRPDGFYLVDTSTNGSFLTLSGHQETLVRCDEVRLEGRGRICFGGSSNDPTAAKADFELA